MIVSVNHINHSATGIRPSEGLLALCPSSYDGNSLLESSVFYVRAILRTGAHHQFITLTDCVRKASHLPMSSCVMQA